MRNDQKLGARALLLDERGMVTEASTANILIYRASEGLISPLANRGYRKISMNVKIAMLVAASE